MCHAQHVHETGLAHNLQPLPTRHMQPLPSDCVSVELYGSALRHNTGGFGGGAPCIHGLRRSVLTFPPFAPTSAVNDLLGSSSSSTWASRESEQGVSLRDGFPACPVPLASQSFGSKQLQPVGSQCELAGQGEYVVDKGEARVGSLCHTADGWNESQGDARVQAGLGHADQGLQPRVRDA